MVLDFGGQALFKQSGLEQDTGLLKDRWAQDGSDIKVLTHNGTASGTVYTVTAGKRLYVNSIYIGAAYQGNWFLKDNSTDKLVYVNNPSAYENETLVFDPPLFFDTSVEYVENVAVTSMIITINGWEEEAP